MEKHVEIFDEDDENKLEYSEIFEEYVKILETMIDANLFKKYDQAKVKGFYDNFAKNISGYT